VILDAPQALRDDIRSTACSEPYDLGTTVTLTTTPTSESLFTGWSGCDAVDGATCTVTMNAAAAVTARFDRQQFTLTASRSGLGTGTITSSPAGINCGADCSEGYVIGTVVTLTATPAVGSVFMGWTGCDAVSGSQCTVVAMNSVRSVTAHFLGLPIILP
jgi:Divergent InlB B-repeat domain